MNTTDHAVSVGHMLSHGILALSSMLLLAALLERITMLAMSRFRRPCFTMSQARGLYATFAWVGGIAPMAGLLGTVTGIMTSFSAAGSTGRDQYNIMSGVALALIATAAGLLLAMVAFTGRALFGRATDQWLKDAKELRS